MLGRTLQRTPSGHAAAAELEVSLHSHTLLGPTLGFEVWRSVLAERHSKYGMARDVRCCKFVILIMQLVREPETSVLRSTPLR